MVVMVCLPKIKEQREERKEGCFVPCLGFPHQNIGKAGMPFRPEAVSFFEDSAHFFTKKNFIFVIFRRKTVIFIRHRPFQHSVGKFPHVRDDCVFGFLFRQRDILIGFAVPYAADCFTGSAPAVRRAILPASAPRIPAAGPSARICRRRR